MKIKTFFKSLIFLIFGFIIIYFIFKNQDLNKMVLKLKSANYCYLIISMIFGFCAYIFRALRWQILINTMQYSSKFGPALHSISIGYLANVIFPRAGEIVRCTYFNQVTKVPVKKLIGNVILERVIDLSILIVLLLFSFTIKFNEISIFFSNFKTINPKNYIPILVLISILICLLFIFRKRILRFNFLKKLQNFLSDIQSGFKSIFYINKKNLFSLYTILIWLMYIFMTQICFYSIPETSNLNFFDGIYITVIGGLGMIIPVQGGIGSYHAAVTLALLSLGHSETTGITLAILIHTAQSVMILFSGTISTVVLSFQKIKS